MRRSSQYGKNVACIGAIVVGRHSFEYAVLAELNWMFPFDEASAVVYDCP